MKKSLCILLIIVMPFCLLSLGISVSAENNIAKIDSQLLDSLNNLSSKESVLSLVTMTDIDHQAVLNEFQRRYPDEYIAYRNAKYLNDFPETVLESSAKTGIGVNKASTYSVNDELLQMAIQHKRDIYTEFYSSSNTECLKKYLGDNQIIYMSSYTPVAIVKADAATIHKMAKSSHFISFALFEVKECVQAATSLELANQITRADYVRDTCNNTGSGVKIGLLEANGIPDDTYPDLSSACIYTRNGDTNIQDHATKMATIIVGENQLSNHDGLAPDAELYCCYAEDTSYLRGAVEWLISSGVNIINMSAGFDNEGTYDSFSAWFDHIAVQYDVHVVIAAGNFEEDQMANKYIHSPAMAYNAITVGGLDPNGSDTVANFDLYQDSCYIETGTVRPEKPNLIAPAVGIFAREGTSLAAPQVTGIIAQLCSLDSSLKVKQSAVGAILSASAAEKVQAVGAGGTGDVFLSAARIAGCSQMSDWEGAGIVDARWARGIVLYNNYWSATIDKNSFPYSRTMTIDASSNSLIRVAIFWLKRNTVNDFGGWNSTQQTSFTNLDLYIYDPNGNLVGSSTTSNANFEIVQFVPTVSGSYTVTIRGISTDKEHVGFAAW